ncbi:hypothetical protein NL108_007869 [Boleophthalmus pectinirostris]|nr:hypothetical protein NL108_007869 [Boleophthalmus pectinirostris]
MSRSCQQEALGAQTHRLSLVQTLCSVLERHRWFVRQTLHSAALVDCLLRTEVSLISALVDCLLWTEVSLLSALVDCLLQTEVSLVSALVVRVFVDCLWWVVVACLWSGRSSPSALVVACLLRTEVSLVYCRPAARWRCSTAALNAGDIITGMAGVKGRGGKFPPFPGT